MLLQTHLQGIAAGSVLSPLIEIDYPHRASLAQMVIGADGILLLVTYQRIAAMKRISPTLQACRQHPSWPPHPNNPEIFFCLANAVRYDPNVHERQMVTGTPR